MAPYGPLFFKILYLPLDMMIVFHQQRGHLVGAQSVEQLLSAIRFGPLFVDLKFLITHPHLVHQNLTIMPLFFTVHVQNTKSCAQWVVEFHGVQRIYG